MIYLINDPYLAVFKSSLDTPAFYKSSKWTKISDLSSSITMNP